MAATYEQGSDDSQSETIKYLIFKVLANGRLFMCEICLMYAVNLGLSNITPYILTLYLRVGPLESLLLEVGSTLRPHEGTEEGYGRLGYHLTQQCLGGAYTGGGVKPVRHGGVES